MALVSRWLQVTRLLGCLPRGRVFGPHGAVLRPCTSFAAKFNDGAKLPWGF